MQGSISGEESSSPISTFGGFQCRRSRLESGSPAARRTGKGSVDLPLLSGTLWNSLERVGVVGMKAGALFLAFFLLPVSLSMELNDLRVVGGGGLLIDNSPKAIKMRCVKEGSGILA